MADRMTSSRVDRKKVGRAGRPKQIPPGCREGVGTHTVV